MNARQRAFEKIINEIDNYMSDLYQEDVEKFRVRAKSLQLIQNLFNHIAAKSKTAFRIKNTSDDVATTCAAEEAKYRGKGGRQAYSNLLARLQSMCTVSAVATQKDITEDLKAAIRNVRAESNQLFVAQNVIVLRKIKKYVGVIEKEIAQAKKGGIFTKKINVPLSEKKQNIAETLQIALQEYNVNPSKDTLVALQKSIIEAEANHHEALKGEIGGSKRLGGLITDLKETMKHYAPIEFNNAAKDGEKKYQRKFR